MKLNIMKWSGTEIAERGMPSEGNEAGDGGVYPDCDTGIWGLNLLLNTLNFITKWSATGTGTGEQGNLHVGGTNTPGERDEAEGGEGGDDDDNCECRGANDVQQNNQHDIRVIVSTGYEQSFWNRNPVPEQQYSRCRGIYIENVPAKLKESYLTPILTFLFRKTEKKPNTNVIESKVFVSCPMKRTESQVPTHHNSKHFGWCQNCLDVLYQCLECDAAIYSGSSIL